MSEPHMAILIKGGRIIDPALKRDEVGDILIENGLIREIAPSISTPEGAAQVIDAAGKVVTPGLIDLHTHVREPGYEYKETVATATASAAAGGFTTICCMPNTNPVNDNQSVTELILEKTESEGLVRVFPIGAITKGQKGKELAEIGELVKAGCVAISDDGLPVMNSQVMRLAMSYAKIFDVPVIDHCEDLNLTNNGVIFEGNVSTRLGLRGIPACSETVMVARDLALAELTEAKVHLAHISTAGSVQLIREAKRRGIRVTAETCPHYFALTDEAVGSFNTNAKMKPPLAGERDREEILSGLKDGTIDLIATDHAPHASDEKEQAMDCAPFGIIGLETALPLSLELLEKNILTLPEVIQKFTSEPARVLGKKTGQLDIGGPADITIIDLDAEWIVDAKNIISMSKNSPFIGRAMKGRATAVIVGGKLIMNQGLRGE